MRLTGFRRSARSLRVAIAALLILLASATLWYRQTTASAPALITGAIPSTHILLPDGPANAVVVLFSDAGGWSGADQTLADHLRASASAVVGIDLPQYRRSLARESGDCHYLISDIESLSHQIQRVTGSTGYSAPILAGAGAGGGLALDLVTQTPAATIGATVVVDPSVGITLDRPLCTDARHTDKSGQAIYTLPSGTLVDPVAIRLTPAATPEARRRAEAFSHTAQNATLSDIDAGDPLPPLAQALAETLGAQAATAQTLPIQVLSTTPTHQTLAIFLSGDGGWRDLDKTIGDIFQTRGLPTIGLDSLHYFWTKRTPQQTAHDIDALVARYGKGPGTPDILLAGYSFGADVLAETYLNLAPATQARVRQISLLGLSPAADWEITVSGWLERASSAARPTAPALAKLPAAKLQCIYGIEETDSPCPGLAASGAETIRTRGGHHFDGNFPAIADKIIAGLDRRRNQPAAS